MVRSWKGYKHLYPTHSPLEHRNLEMDAPNGELQRHFDVVLSDINSSDLHTHIEKCLGVKYLEDFVGDGDKKQDRVKGAIVGMNMRAFVPLVMRYKRQAKTVIFLIDTSCPFTFVSEEVLTAFKVTLSQPDSPLQVLLNGCNTTVQMSPLDKHFPEVNVLGSDFFLQQQCDDTLQYRSEAGHVMLSINAGGNEWLPFYPTLPVCLSKTRM